MPTGKFYGIGLGPGDPGLVTLKAAEHLRRVGVIFSASSRQSERSVSGDIVATLAGVVARQVELSFPMGSDRRERQERTEANARLIMTELETGTDVAFVTIGDPLTYSTCAGLLRMLKIWHPELAAEIIPGVNSWSALAAAAQIPLVEDREQLRILPSYVIPEEEDFDHLTAGKDTVVLLKTYRSRNDLVARLRQRGIEFVYGANLGLDGQFVSGLPDEIIRRNEEYLSMLIIKPKQEG